MNKPYVLYEHKNKVNGKLYIGITKDVSQRWSYNGIYYKPDKGRQSAFWNAIKKYGWDAFEHKILIKNLSFEEACYLEKEYIKKYHTSSKKNGYNISPGGNGGHVYREHPRGMLGHHQTKEWSHNKSLEMRSKSKNPMTNGSVIWGINYEHPKGMKGHHQTEKHRLSMKRFRGSKHPNSKQLRITFPNGNIEIWPTMSMFNKTIGFYKVYELVKTGKEYKVDLKHIKTRDKEKCIKYSGCTFSNH